MISWTRLEELIGLETLPAFHRAFLESRGVQTEGMMLRRVQQAVERELNRLVAAGQARRDQDQVLVDPAALPNLGLPDGRSVRDLLDQLLRQSA